jgi:integrase
LTALYATRSNAGEFLAGFQQPGPRLAYNVGRSFGESVARAGVPRMRLHNLRHVNASLDLSTGTSVKAVAARLGHSYPSITLRTYAHVMPQKETAAAERLGALLAAET